MRLGLYGLASAILLVLCLLPQDRLPEVGASDKVEHAIAWFVLTITGYLLAPRRMWAIPAYALVFGVFVELMQAYGVQGRHGDLRDFMVDAAGVAAATLLYHALPRRLLA
jgi:VanZ family protein